MALRKPQFETVNETMITDNEATETVMDTSIEAANEAREAREPVQASVPAVRTTSTAVGGVNEAAAMAKQFQRELDEMKGASDFSYGNYEVYKGNNGEIAQTGGKSDVSLGRWAKVRLLGWDDHHEITPGSQDKTSKDFVAYSKDGKTIDSVIGEEQKSWVGKSVDAYVDYLRNDEGFDKAGCKRYVDLACALLGSDTGDGPVNAGVIQITLSPSSIPSFSKYQQSLKDQARCVAMGLTGFKLPEDPFTFFVIREVVSAGGNKWTKLVFATSLPAKL